MLLINQLRFQSTSPLAKQNKTTNSSISFGSLPLEDLAMRAIGLGAHYNYFNGSGSCSYIRMDAVKKLPDVITQLAKEGNEIIEPYGKLIDTLSKIATTSESNSYSLTKTWQAASDTIRIHMDAFYKPENERPDFLEKAVEYLEKNYLKK